MFDHQLWVSVQSEYGISLGELGKLPSDTDPKLVGNILVSLKDVIATEASNTVSDFMETTIDSGAAGVIALRASDSFKIMMTYFASRIGAGPVDPEVISIAKSLSRNLGKQLPQMINLEKLASTGAAIPHKIMTKAFLNTCNIVRMSYTLPNQKRPLLKAFEEEFERLLSDKPFLFDLIDKLFGTKGWKIATYNWNNGFLKRERREELIEELTIFILGNIARNNPKLLLNVEQTQNIIKDFEKFLMNLLRSKISHPEKVVIKALSSVMDEKSVNDALSKIHLRSLHNSEDIIFAQMTRKAILHAMKTNPELIFVEIPDKEIRKQFMQMLPHLEFRDAGYYYSTVLEKHVPPAAAGYVRAFYDGFFKKMSGITLTKSAWEILSTFALNFIDAKTLIEEFKALEEHSKGGRWKKELIKWVQEKKVTQLKVETIQEVIVLANASSLAITQSIYDLMIDQFLYTKSGELGRTVNHIVELIHRLGPPIKVTTFLIDVLDHLKDTVYGADIMAPYPQTYVATLLEDGELEVFLHGDPLTMNRRGVFVVGEEEFTPIMLVERFNELEISEGGKTLMKGFTEIPAELVHRVIRDENRFARCLEHAATLKIGALNSAVAEHIDLLEKQLADFIKVIQKGGSSLQKSLRPLSFSKFNVDFIDQTHYPSHMRSLIASIHAEISTFVEKISPIWEKVVTELRDGKFGDRRRKGIEKDLKKHQKQVSKLRKSLETKVKKFEKEVKKTINKEKRYFKNSYVKSGKNILKFSQGEGKLLMTSREIRDVIFSQIESSSVLNRDQVDQLQVGIALEIFETPSDVILEPAYNELIQNTISKFVRSILIEARDRNHFEKLLVDRSYQIVDKMYDALNKIFTRVNRSYLSKSTPVSFENGEIFLFLGTLPVPYFRDPKVISSSFNIPGIKVERTSSFYEISFKFPESVDTDENLSLVTLSDAIRYLAKEKLRRTVDLFIEAVASISELLEPNAGDRLMILVEKLYDVVYSSLVTNFPGTS